MKNKGIIGLGLILAIVLGVAVVGGGAYYLGKSKEENKEVNNQDQNLPVAENPQTAQVSTGCVSTSQPFVKVLSPNGGEVFTIGDTITVKWESCNVSSGTNDLFIALHQNGEWKNVIYLDNATLDDGSESFIISSDVLAGSYKIRVGSPAARILQDFSDNYFTINSEAKDVSVAAWKEYSNSEYGFRFNYPGDWKLTEDKIKKEVTIETNDIGEVVEGGNFPSWRITFKSTDKTFFNNLQPTKIGVITYNEKESAVFADDRCIKGTKLLGGLIQAFTYGGSSMSDPAYWNSAILTKNGQIIIVNSYQGSVITSELEKQLSTIVNTFKLLNGNSFFIPECSK